jgi:hypothetical protein
LLARNPKGFSTNQLPEIVFFEEALIMGYPEINTILNFCKEYFLNRYNENLTDQEFQERSLNLLDRLHKYCRGESVYVMGEVAHSDTPPNYDWVMKKVVRPLLKQ